MSQSTSSDEQLAAQLAKELNEAAEPGKPNEGIIALLHRIQDEVPCTVPLSESEAGRALDLAIGTCSTGQGRWEDDELRDLVTTVKNARYAQLRDAKINAAQIRAWHVEPMPDGCETITLEFRDVTPEHKTWPVNELWQPEVVECAASEPFEHAAQRFRVHANKKYRHPFHHSMQFDAILKTERASLGTLGTRTVGEIIGQLAEDRIVPYIRNDEDNRGEWDYSPVRMVPFWERTLPEWCSTPDHWIEPVPPPSYDPSNTTHGPMEQYYVKVPTLNIPGNGRIVLPSTEKPQIIARSLFLPIENWGSQGEFKNLANLKNEEHFVPPGAHLVPGQITLDAARGLLGRVIQSSQNPRTGTEGNEVQRPSKRRKLAFYGIQKVGYAWGLELEEDGSPGWLHCFYLFGTYSDQYVLDLTGKDRRYQEQSPIEITTVKCAWLGIAVLPVDQKATQGVAESGASTAAGAVDVPKETESADSGENEEDVEEDEEEKEAMSYDKWYDRTQKWIKNLHNKAFSPVVEVGPDGTFVGGDLALSKGDEDEFEAEITGAKPGIWLISIETAQSTENEDEDEDQDQDEVMDLDAPKIARFVWVADGAVDFDHLPSSGTYTAPSAPADTEWENAGSFSVDSGTACLFSKHALDKIIAEGPEDEREAMLECFMDLNLEAEPGQGEKYFVPGGVVLNGNDGGYEIESRRNEDGQFVELRLRA